MLDLRAHNGKKWVRFHMFWIASLTGAAQLLPDDDPHARQQWLTSQVPGSAKNAAAVRLFGTELLTVRIDLDSSSQQKE